MKTVVLQHASRGIVFNRELVEYARTRGVGMKACNVRRANEKGAWRGPLALYARSRFWPGRRFSSLMDLNVKALQ
jgi:transposase